MKASVSTIPWFLPSLTVVVGAIAVCLGFSFRTTELGPTLTPASELKGDSFKGFGDVQAGSQVEHEFELTCRGDYPITVTGVRTSCQCLAVHEADLVGKKLFPGQSLRCSVAMNVPAVLSTHSATALVEYTSNGFLRSQSLKVMAAVTADYQLSESELSLGELSDHFRTKEFTVHLTQVHEQGSPIEIKRVRCEDDRVTVSLLSSSKFTVSYCCELERAAKIRIPIVVETTSSLLPRSSLKLYGSFVPSISVEPTSVFIGSSEQRESFILPLHVKTTRNSIVSVDTSECTFCESLSVDSDSLERIHVVNVKITPPKSSSEGVLKLIAESEGGDKTTSSISVVRF